MLPLTKQKLHEFESASIDLMDAELQLLLTMTWEHEQGNGLTQLRNLSKLVKEKVGESPHIFETERDRESAAWAILNSLQHANNIGVNERGLSYSLLDWSISPTNKDLLRLHRETKAPYFVVVSLVREAKAALDDRTPKGRIMQQIRTRIRLIGEREQFPFHVPALAACIMAIASRPGRIVQSELIAEVESYEKGVEGIAADPARIKRMEIVAELLPTAKQIRLKIDQCYSWSDLASFSGSRTSLNALSHYTQLNHYGYVSDARFSPQRVAVKILPSDFFYSQFSIWFLRASTLMFSGDDRETRILRRSIIDSDRANIRVYDKGVLDSLALLVPLDDPNHDIGRQLALLLMRLNLEWQKRHSKPKESAEFLEKLPPSLRHLVVSHGMRRKIVSSKKTILYCLAGLIAENSYRYRHQNKDKLEPLGIKNRSDFDDYVSKLIHQHGFQYSSETLRRRRSNWHREFLDRVPEIFGLDDAST